MIKLIKIEPIKKEKKKLKVAAYCRVSTKFESQQSSIDLQISNCLAHTSTIPINN